MTKLTPLQRFMALAFTPSTWRPRKLVIARPTWLR